MGQCMSEPSGENNYNHGSTKSNQNNQPSRNKSLRNNINKGDEIYLEICKTFFNNNSPPTKVMGYTRIKQKTEEVRVWVKGNEHVIVAFRGTTTWQDYWTNANIALEWLIGKSNRSEASLLTVKRLKQKYKCPFTYTGHSLGGRLALDVCKENPNDYAVTFNAYVCHLNQQAQFLKSYQHLNVRYYRSNGDMVSSFIRNDSFKEIITVECCMDDRHDILNFKVDSPSTAEQKIGTIKILANGNYRIISQHSGKSLDVSEASKKTGAKIIQWDSHNGENQLFCITRQQSGYYTVKCAHSGLYWDICGASTQNGGQLIQYGYSGADNQLFNFMHNSGNKWYIISKNSGKGLDIAGWSKQNGGGVNQYDLHYGANQVFVCKIQNF